jgi:hypothetical protein
MNALDISGVQIPLPDGWNLSPGGQSYVGQAGILDIRANARGSPINEDRRRLAEEELSRFGAKVEIGEIQGVSALYCRYKENNCTIVSYSLQLSLGNEVVAVYVFRPGQEVLELEIDLAFRSY